MHKYLFLIAFVFVAVISTPSFADCTNPAKSEGFIIYNKDHKVAQFCNGTDWIGMAGGATSVMTGDTMVDVWPDAIVCNVSNPNWGNTVFNALHMPLATDGKYYYRVPNPDAVYGPLYNADGSFSVYHNLVATSCDGKSIAQLYTDGQAFNFVGGGTGAGSDTLAELSCADGQMVLYDTGSSDWICADVSASGAADNLGNHTATQTLDMASFGIDNVESITLDSVTDGAAPISGSDNGVPTGFIGAFDLASCPTGWSEYTVARGRFLRGIDPSGTNDPDGGVRVVGGVQADAFQDHDHTPQIYSGTPVGGGDWQFAPGAFTGSKASSNYDPYPTDSPVNYASYNGTGGGGHDRGYRTSTETRPKNVAVLYCRKN